MPPGLLSPQGGKFEEEEREANKQALSNIMSDTLSGGLLGVAVATNRRRVGLLRGWLGWGTCLLHSALSRSSPCVHG